MPPESQQPPTPSQAPVSSVAPISAPQTPPALSAKETSTLDPNSPASFVASKKTETEDLKRAAMLAMEGEEGKRAREQEERRAKEAALRSKLEDEKVAIEVKLRQILQQKEALELEWIKYNNQKQPLEEQEQPIKAEEKSAEEEERKIEQEEAVAASTPGTPVAVMQEIEQRRWLTQEKRHHAEEQKWAFETRIEQLRASEEALGGSYRQKLKEEDDLRASLREAEATLANLHSDTN